MVRVATMCAREGDHETAIAVLRRALAPEGLPCDAGLPSGTSDAGAWRETLGRWMVSQQLAPPWPGTFALLARSMEAQLAALVVGLVEQDRLFVGRRVLAFDEKSRTWRQAAVNSISDRGEVDVTAGGWKKLGGLSLTKVSRRAPCE